ncbi:HET-domain-containing protein [Amniculicola lignicola CBS 123094]|uniref:HET-domain-containing protein n=1 Tax=Amniculicola lignicola CBS 123094 TaxID=1392246 RepID=A0A6A5W0D9_9PLEO|nr:HET-domain-containing protein [Amniculicola lignicola CBS 123094]
MRLLRLGDDGEYEMDEYFGKDIPAYAILSHVWGTNAEEVNFKDMIHSRGQSKAGYSKIRFCGKQAARDGLQFFWVDTCCIDKSSSAELSEAINSMFHWYQNAAKCYVYLRDVSIASKDWKKAFEQSRWFQRGWTLQELLAPTSVDFFSIEGEHLQDKVSLVQELHEITGIPIQALQECPLSQFSLAERMWWAEKRETKREEDAAYSLMGIFDTHMPLIYGEGRRKAFYRLQREIKESAKISVAHDGTSLAGSKLVGFVWESGSVLSETDDTWKFMMSNMNEITQPDLVAIKTSGTGTNSTEVHIISGDSGFNEFSLQTGTSMHETSTTQYDFALTNWNGDSTLDLVVIKKNGTDTKSTEVYILSGASNYQDFILQTNTALHETDESFDFAMGRRDATSKPDLFAIKRSKTSTKTTEVIVLSGSSEFQEIVLHTGTALYETDATFAFAVADWNADGNLDLVAVKMSNTSSSSTELHVLSGLSNYKSFLLHSETGIHETDSSVYEFALADWMRDGKVNVVGIKKRNTGTNSTEVHILDR